MKSYCQNCGNNTFYLSYIDINNPESLAWRCEECEAILRVVTQDEKKESDD